MKSKLISPLVSIIFLYALLPTVYAHQSGCHSWHSCPSDTGSYVCGDKGYCSQCPDNQYCQDGVYMGSDGETTTSTMATTTTITSTTLPPSTTTTTSTTTTSTTTTTLPPTVTTVQSVASATQPSVPITQKTDTTDQPQIISTSQPTELEKVPTTTTMATEKEKSSEKPSSGVLLYLLGFLRVIILSILGNQVAEPATTSATAPPTTLTTLTSTTYLEPELKTTTTLSKTATTTVPPRPTLTATQTTSTTISQKELKDNVTIHFINVPIGDAIYIDTNGKDVILDASTKSNGATVVNYMKGLGKGSIDIILPSNHDSDHMGGLITAMNSMSVLTAWDSGSTKDTLVFSEYISLAKTKNFIIVERGQTYQLDDMTRVTILNPTQPNEFTKENDNSVVFKMIVGNVSFLFAGDCETPCENSILASGLDVSATFLKAGHHCSRTSTSNAFLDKVNPKTAFCLAGTEGYSRYGHPHREVTSKFDIRGIPYYVTMDDGNIVVTTDGNDYSIKTL